MSPSMKAVRERAQELFLGHGHVIGVGISDERNRRLVFLLDEESTSSKREYELWAAEFGVQIEFYLAGQPIAADRKQGR
jgi:hypothetical protein